MDMGIELPSLSFAVTDYVTLIIEGDEIGFSIGVPLASCSKETDYHTDFQNSAEKNKLYSFTHTTKGEWETGNPVSENIDQAQGILDNLNPKGEQWKSIKAAQHANMKRDSRSKPILDHGYPQYNDKLIKSSSQQFSMAVNVTVMFKYSPVDNTYHFTSAMVFLQFGFEYRKEVRLSCCPIIYAYVVIGVSLEVAGGVINEREVVEVGQGTSGYIDINSGTSSQYTLSSINELDEWRIDDQDGKAMADLITMADETIETQHGITLFDPIETWKECTYVNCTARCLSTPIYENGKRVYTSPSLNDIKKFCKAQVNTLWDEVKRFENPHRYYVDLSQKLWDTRSALLKKLSK